MSAATCGETRPGGFVCAKPRGHHDDHAIAPPRPGFRASWMNYAWVNCEDAYCAPCRSYRTWHGLVAECRDCGEVVPVYRATAARDERRLTRHRDCPNGGSLVIDNDATLRTRAAIARDDARQEA